MLSVVEPATEFESAQNAFVAAEEERETYADRLKTKTIQQVESMAKTTVRGNTALRQVS